MQIQFLYDEDCPSHDVALQRLHDVMDEVGIDVPVEVIKVENDQQAQQWHFVGSPTILINGQDLIDPPPPDSHYQLGCRAYRLENGRISPLPTPEMIRHALQNPTAYRN